MNLMDSCPERRNFTLICLVTITYFWADGEIKGGNISIPFVNIVLHNGFNALLIYLFIFAWFTFRYWLVFKTEPYSKEKNTLPERQDRKWRSALLSALNSATAPEWILKHFSEKESLQEILIYKNQNNRHFTINEGNFNTHFSGSGAFIAYRLSAGQLEKSQLSGFKKWVAIITIFTKSFFTDPFLPTWYIPWLLFLLSIVFLGHAAVSKAIGLF